MHLAIRSANFSGLILIAGSSIARTANLAAASTTLDRALGRTRSKKVWVRYSVS
jgi:hypothetical protein